LADAHWAPGEIDMNRWQIGDVTITRVVESETTFDMTMLIPNATPENIRKEAWLRPNFADPDGGAKLSIHAFGVESKGRKIIVDTCVGNDKNRKGFPTMHMLKLPFLADLAKAGFARESVNLVMCTHLHLDHVGWNTMLEGGRWVPTFPNARYLMTQREWEHWGSEGKEDAVIGDSVRPVFDAGLVDLVQPDYRITDEIWLEPTHGHTPGHVSVRISSRGHEAVISGDLMHHPIQLGHPEWLCTFDSDPDQGCKTRRAFMERYADKPVLVLGTHFATPTAGHVVREGEAFRFRT
jgi:glyoxylase-like metal-dependent hydrolase (beta-lactamase superfamily II)